MTTTAITDDMILRATPTVLMIFKAGEGVRYYPAAKFKNKHHPVVIIKRTYADIDVAGEKARVELEKRQRKVRTLFEPIYGLRQRKLSKRADQAENERWRKAAKAYRESKPTGKRARAAIIKITDKSVLF